jgi:hypothetical protein
MKRLIPWALPAIVIAIGILYYASFLGNFFAEDDFRYLANVISGPRAIALGYNAQLRLVSNFAWLPIYSLSGFNPFGYNMFNLVVNAINSLLLYAFLKRLLQRRAVAFLATIIFTSCVAGADAILWKMSISTLLSLMFNLSALNLYLRHRTQSEVILCVYSVMFFTMAIFSKEDAAALVGIIVAIELLFFDGWDHKKQLLKRISPYVAVVILFMSVSYATFHLLGLKSETWSFIQFKPLYSLLGGGTAFFISPDGYLKMTDPRLYVTGFLVPLLFLFVREKRMLTFGYLWIFLTFLPSSLTSITSFEPSRFPNSISRLLYTPSIGVSLVMALTLVTFKDRFGGKVFSIVSVVFLVLFVSINFGRVRERGMEWKDSGTRCEEFITDLQLMVPQMPENSYFSISYGPTSAGFTQQMLRAFYKNPKIYVNQDPDKIALAPGDFLFLIFCDKDTNKLYAVKRAH